MSVVSSAVLQVSNVSHKNMFKLHELIKDVGYKNVNAHVGEVKILTAAWDQATKTYTVHLELPVIWNTGLEKKPVPRKLSELIFQTLGIFPE